MGMDFYEIVMGMEDHFGISLQISETSQVRTVGDLVAIVRSRIYAAHQAKCPTLPVFLTLRKVVREIAGNQSLRVRPRDRVANILSPPQRREFWKQLPDMLDRPLQPLRRPMLLRRTLVFFSICILFFAIWSAWKIDPVTLPLAFLLTICVVISLHYLTLPFRSIPPDGWRTFGEITRRLVSTKVATKKVHLQTDEEILIELRPILVKILGIDASEIVPEARLIEDLGMQ